MATPLKTAKPSANGKGGKNGKPKKAPASWKAAFSNYAVDIPLEIDAIADSLLELTGGWPKCISGVLCYVNGDKVCVLADTAALFAWIGSRAPVEWRRGARAVTKEEFFKRLHQRQQWDWATAHPHFPPVPNVYYLQPPPKAKNTGALDELIQCFRPKTAEDGQLIKALALTLFWGGPPGKRPQFVIVADEDEDADAGRGTGKTSVAQYLSELVGGCIDIDHAEDRHHILTNLLSPSSWAQRIVLIDNLKSTRFSNELLEKLITRSEITGHRMYHGFGMRPNLLTYVVTVNGAFFSTDMAQRSVVIRLERPPMTSNDWDADTLAFVTENRQRIVADVRWHLEVKPPVQLQQVDRWGPWCRQVLSRCAEPGALLSHISNQRSTIDADKLDSHTTLDYLRSCIGTYFVQESQDEFAEMTSPDNMIVWAPTVWLVQAVRGLHRHLTIRQAQQFLPRFTSPQLRKADRNNQRGYRWTGVLVDAASPPDERVIVYSPDLNRLS